MGFPVFYSPGLVEWYYELNLIASGVAVVVLVCVLLAVMIDVAHNDRAFETRVFGARIGVGALAGILVVAVLGFIPLCLLAITLVVVALFSNMIATALGHPF